MRYSSTTRLINIIVFALLAFLLGWLGIYHGILVAPFLMLGQGPVGNPTIGWGLSAMLGIFGLAGMAISLYGLVVSVMSLLKERDDQLVRRAFGSYVALGYLLFLFFLLNGTWLFRLTSTNIGYDDNGFVITVYIIAAIITLLVANIPLMRMFGETEELNKVMRVVVGPFLALALAGFVVYGLSFCMSNGRTDIRMSGVVAGEFGGGALFALGILALSVLAFFGYGAADKAGQIRKLNGFAFEGALCLSGIAMIVAGIIEYSYQSVKNPMDSSLIAKSIPNTNGYYQEFAICSWIIGGILVVLALYLVISTIRSKNNAPAAR